MGHFFLSLNFFFCLFFDESAVIACHHQLLSHSHSQFFNIFSCFSNSSIILGSLAFSLSTNCFCYVKYNKIYIYIHKTKVKKVMWFVFLLIFFLPLSKLIELINEHERKGKENIFTEFRKFWTLLLPAISLSFKKLLIFCLFDKTNNKI